MNTLTVNSKKNRHNNLLKPNLVKFMTTQDLNSIVAMTKGWQCCKCKEEMYRDENHCNWSKYGHTRCSSCRSFQV